METDTYTIREGTTNRGREYELAITTLLSLQCINNTPNLKTLWTAFNAKGCGALDDVIIHMENAQNETITYYIQLKCTKAADALKSVEFLNPNLSKGHFYVQTYYQSYKNIKEELKKENKDRKIIFNNVSNLEDSKFILFTNRDAKPCRFLREIDKNENNPINTNGVMYKFFDANDELKCDPAFLAKFYLFSSQVYVDKTNDLIAKTIAKFFPLQQLTREVLNEVTEKLILWITAWSLGELGGHHLLTKVHILNKLTELFISHYKTPFYDKIHLKDSQTEIWNTITSGYVTVFSAHDKNIQQFVQKSISEQILKAFDNPPNITSWNNPISKRHVQKIFERRAEQIKNKLLINMDEIKTLLDLYKVLWRLGEVPIVLKIDNLQDYEKLEQILILNQHQIKVIVINSTNNRLRNRCKDRTFFTKLNDLKPEEVQLVYGRNVHFSGKSIKLANILDDTKYIKEVITPEDVINILSGDFNIGRPHTTVAFYIPQTVSKILVDFGVLSKVNVNELRDIFIIHCKNKHYFLKCVYNANLVLDKARIENYETIKKFKKIPKKCRIILSQSDSFNYCTRVSHENIHELQLHDEDTLEWIQSRESTEVLKNFTVQGRTKPTTENFSRRVNIISGGPGMGKSTLMDCFEDFYSPEYWVLRVNFNEISDYYNSEEFNVFHDDPVKQLEYFNKSELSKHECWNDVNKNVFRRFVSMNKVILLLDGFDEVPSNKKNVVGKIINNVTKKCYKLFVTTRPIDVLELERQLNTFSNTLNSFTLEEQHTYLTKFFGNKMPGAHSEEQLKKFVNELLILSKNMFLDNDNNFTGVPLLTMLLAEAFLDDCVEYMKTGILTLERNVNLLYLYETFIEKNNKRLLAKTSTQEQNIYSSFIKIQQLYALKHLFKVDDLPNLKVDKTLKIVMEFIPNVHEFIQKDGIVMRGSGDNIKFIHQTFAEYLAATWLAENIDGDYKEDTKLILRTIFKPSYDTLRNIFDRITTRELVLHTAVINIQQEEVSKLLEMGRRSVELNTCDKIGRTALHIAAAWGTRHIMPEEGVEIDQLLHNIKGQSDMKYIVKMLLQGGVSGTNDTLLKYTALDYSFLSDSLANADAIIAYINDHLPPINRMEPYLYYCSLGGYNSLLKSLLDDTTDDQRSVMLNKPLNINYKWNALHWTVAKGHKETTFMLLSSGSRVNEIDGSGTNALQILLRDCKNNVIDLVKTLLQSKISVNHVNILKRTALMFAVIHYSPIWTKDVLAALLTCDADMNLMDHNGYTALHLACSYGNLALVDFLVDKGADVNATTGGFTALHIAATQENTEILKSLLSHKCEVDVTYNDGIDYLHLTPLLEGCLRGTADNVNVLLDNGACFKSHEALRYASQAGNTEIIRLLLSRGVDVDITCEESGNTALFEAVKKQKVEAVEALLNAGITVDKRNHQDETALDYALEHKNSKIVSLLLEHGAPLNANSLHVAARSKCLRNISQIISCGADVNVVNRHEETALHIAAHNNDSESINLLIDVGSNVDQSDHMGLTPLFKAISVTGENAVDELLSHGADVNVRNNHKCTPLHYAAISPNPKILSLILPKVADINVIDGDGTTALHEACKAGYSENVRLLLSCGADVNRQNSEGRSIIHVAARSGSYDVLKIVLSLLSKSKKFDIDLKETEFGWTALHDACYGGNLDSISLLLSHGANINAIAFDGETPLHVAATVRNTDVVDLLIANEADVSIKDKRGKLPRGINKQNCT